MIHIDKPVSTDQYACSRDMAAAPGGRKLIAVNHGGVACFTQITDKNRGDFQAWAPLPILLKETK